ncbi:MAG TPA: hypothetical protein VHE80_00680 [Acidimicrobiales bacterium]|nr:hypothetical protein [Acidimicrobiales bacterium]
MRRNIVEGEPGIFPDPIARLMRSLGRWVRRRAGEDDRPTEEEEGHSGPDRPYPGPPPGPPAF